jgi:hypothetical protein
MSYTQGIVPQKRRRVKRGQRVILPLLHKSTCRMLVDRRVQATPRGVSAEQTFYRWKKQYAGQQSELSLEKAILLNVASRKRPGLTLRPARRSASANVRERTDSSPVQLPQDPRTARRQEV